MARAAGTRRRLLPPAGASPEEGGGGSGARRRFCERKCRRWEVEGGGCCVGAAREAGRGLNPPSPNPPNTPHPPDPGFGSLGSGRLCRARPRHSARSKFPLYRPKGDGSCCIPLSRLTLLPVLENRPAKVKLESDAGGNTFLCVFCERLVHRNLPRLEKGSCRRDRGPVFLTCSFHLEGYCFARDRMWICFVSTFALLR